MLNIVPVPGQSLGSSRDLISGNFSVINTAFSVNHVPYNDGSGNQGLHQFVQIPSATPVIATALGQIGLYSNTGTTSGVPELFFQRQNLAASSGYAITEGTNATIGWCRLPSGLLMKWNKIVSFGGASSIQVNLNAAPNVGPNFTTILTVMITPVVSANFDHVIAISNFTAPGLFTVATMNGASAPNTLTFSFLALGI